MPKPLPLSPAQANDLVNEYGTPLQVYSEQGMRTQVRSLVDAFHEAGFASFKQYFAVKALPNPAILRVLMSEGCGLDCSSTGELWVSDKLGCKEIMYTSNYTSQKDLELALRQEGVIINLDDVSLVDSLADVCKRTSLPFPSLICFRVNPGMGNTSSETDSNLLGGPNAKFGVPLEDILVAYTKAKQHGATRFGIHMMTGSCVMDTNYWSVTVGTLLRTMLRIQSALTIEFEFVNIGGGIGIPYRPEERESNVREIARTVAHQFTTQLGPDANQWPRLAMENGRFITGPFGWLITRVHATKECYGKHFFGVDACMANLMRPGMYGSYHHIEVLGRNGTPSPFNVVGTLCENNDWFAKDRLLPSNTQVGDLLVLFDTGAHSHSMGFQYNAKLRAPEVLLDMNNVPMLIRDREVIEDLFCNTRLPRHLRGSNLPERITLKTSSPRGVWIAATAVLVISSLAIMGLRSHKN